MRKRAPRISRITIRRPVAEGYLVEHLDVYTARLPDGVEPCNRDGEVERFECLDRAALEQRLLRGEFTLEASLILAETALPRAGASVGPRIRST